MFFGGIICGMREVVAEVWQASDTALVDAVTALEARMRQDYSTMLSLLSEMDSRGVATKLGYSNSAALLVRPGSPLAARLQCFPFPAHTAH